MPTAAKPKQTELQKLLLGAEKKYGLTVGPIASIATDTQWLTTGNLAIDYALGGGIPMGRSVELFGPPSSGKTTLALHCAIELQKVIKRGGDPRRGIRPDDVIMYFDYEHAMDIEYAVKLGLDPEHPSMQFTQPDTLEQGADLSLAAFKTGGVRLALVDSVAAMNPSAQADADSVGKSLPAVQAKLMKPYGQNLNPVLKNNNGSIIFINHEMEKMDMGGMRRPGMPAATTTPGGSALKYFASVRVQFKQIRNHKGPWTDPTTREVIEIPLQTDVLVKVVKNKVAPPFRQATVRVRFGHGFDQFWTAMQILLANKKIVRESSNGRYYFHNIQDDGGAPEWMKREDKGTQRPYIHGEKNVFSAADKDPVWRERLIILAEGVVKDNVDLLAKVAREGEPEPEDEEPDELDDLIGANDEGNRVEI